MPETASAPLFRRSSGAWIDVEREVASLGWSHGDGVPLRAVTRTVWEELASPRLLDDLFDAVTAAHGLDHARAVSSVHNCLTALYIAGHIERA